MSATIPEGGSNQAPDIPLHSGVSTPQPAQPRVVFDNQSPDRLSEADWGALSNDLYQSVNASLAARGALQANLKEWSDAYDLILSQKDQPFFDSASIRLPFTAGQLESMLSYIAAQALPPRIYMVSGNTEQAVSTAFDVEKFYNAEFLRLRSDGSSYYARHLDWLHMALRDGTCVMEALWNRRRQRKRAVSYAPKTDDQGVAVIDPKTGMPSWDELVNEVDVYVKDYCELTPISLKEFILIPDEAQSIEDAAGVARVEWLYEDQLDRMIRAGLLDSGEVERALNYVPSGTSDVAADRTGTYDKSISEQIGIGMGQGSITSRFFKNRGPIKVWRIHSRQFDMNKDGVVEENIFYLHELSQRMLGWMPYDYASGQRPFFAFSPFPRPDRFYGFSLIERLSAVQSEMDSIRSARRDRIDLGLSPPIAVPTGSENHIKKGEWRPGAILEVDFEMGKPAMQLFELSESNIIPAWQEQASLKQDGTEYTGMNMPSAGAQSSGRRTATEMRQQSAGSGVRLSLIAMRLRISAGQVVNFQHQLNKQYLREPPTTISDNQVISLSLETMSQDYTISVVGSGDPIDSSTRRNENITLYDILRQDPLIAQSPMKLWYLQRDLLESFNKTNVYQIIGTEVQAQQNEQAMQQARMAQQQQAQLGQPPGQPGQPGQAQPQPQAQLGPGR